MKALAAVRVLAATFDPDDDKRGSTPPPVPREAILYFQSKGLTPAFSYRDVWREEHNVAFTVAKVMEADILASVQKSLLSAIEDGTTFDEWKKDIKPTLDKSGWSSYVNPSAQPHRLVTIFETNMRVARAVGQWQRIVRTRRALPYLVYELGPSERHRPAHVAMAGIIRPVDDEFWAQAMPPNGWGCKCHVRQITKYESDKRGGETDDSAMPYDDDGDVEGIPDEWRYNPGASSRERLEKIRLDAGE